MKQKQYRLTVRERVVQVSSGTVTACSEEEARELFDERGIDALRYFKNEDFDTEVLELVSVEEV